MKESDSRILTSDFCILYPPPYCSTVTSLT